MRGNVAHMTPFIAEGPFFNLHHNLVHAVQSDDVVMTMVDGAVVAENGTLLNGDMGQYIADAERTAARGDRAADGVADGECRGGGDTGVVEAYTSPASRERLRREASRVRVIGRHAA